MEKTYIVDGNSTDKSRDGQYAVWKVTTREGHLISAFYGPASYHAANVFCDHINSNPNWG